MPTSVWWAQRPLWLLGPGLVLVVLVRLFASHPSTCLFGTLSLWQGVDVPGSACHLVVIDRIKDPEILSVILPISGVDEPPAASTSQDAEPMAIAA